MDITVPVPLVKSLMSVGAAIALIYLSWKWIGGRSL
ncbi:MAG: hypothetical protein ACI9AH_000642 [Oceanospirillaceae bacterium]